MSGFYYLSGGYPLFNAASNSILDKSEAAAVQAGFDKLPDPTGFPNAIWKCKANETGADVSVATLTSAGHLAGLTRLTVPVGVYSTDAASLADIAALPSGTLPSVTGKDTTWSLTPNAGGTAVQWTQHHGLGGTTTTGNVTLTATTLGAYTDTPATPGLYFTLPDATTCTEGVGLLSIYNAGDYDRGIKDSTGTQIGWLRPRTGCIIGLADNSTAAGVWTPYGLEKLGITAQYVNSTATNQTNVGVKRIAVDANRTCFLFGGVDCYAIIYDASSQTWGTATLVRATISSGAFVGVLSAANQVMVVSCTSTTGMEAVCLTISGTGITVETATKSAVVLAGNFAVFGQLIAVGTSWVVSYGRATTTSGIREITLTGVTPVVRSENALETANVATAAQLYASGNVCRTLIADLTATLIYCKPWTISGGASMSAGTSASVTISASANFRAFVNGNGNIVCIYTNSTAYATIFKLTSTTEAASSATIGTVYTADALTNAEIAVISASKTAVLWQSATTAYRANIITDSAGTISNGTPITGTIKATAGWSAPVVSGTDARFAGIPSNSATDNNYLITLSCSGASPTLSAALVASRNQVTSASKLAIPSDAFGNRNPSTLYAGSLAYVIGSASAPVSHRYSANSITQFQSPQIAVDMSTTIGVTGASANESWLLCSFNTSTTGTVIQRVEAAA